MTARLKDRLRPMSPAASRTAWLNLAIAARRIAAHAPTHPVLAHAVREAAKAPFPIEDFSAREAASGLICVAKAYDAAGASRRDLLEPALAACARAVDLILDEPANDRAVATRRQLGERED